MGLDLDTFLTALYTTVDDLYQGHIRGKLPQRPGPKPSLSDSEVLTLALLAQWRHFPSERAFWRWAQAHLLPYFPDLVCQPRFNRRVRWLWDALGLLFKGGASLVVEPSAYRVLDATSVPVVKLPRWQRSAFRGEARISWCAARQEWYFGFKLFVAVTPEGVITSAGLLPANVGDRPGAEVLFQQEQHPYYLGDKGFCSVQWEQKWWAEYGVRVLAAPFSRHRRAWPKAVARHMSGMRQIVEVVFSNLKDCFGLERHRAKTLLGLWARTGAKLAAYTLAQYLNRLYHRPTLAFATLCSW